MDAKHVRIYGLVQGVFYRSSMQEEAQRLGLSGWVRNRQDGSVEALVCGNRQDVEAILRWAESGPDLARVERIVISESMDTSSGGFEVLPTR